MGKLTRLLTSPVRLIADAGVLGWAGGGGRRDGAARLALVNFAPWKRDYARRAFAGHELEFVPLRDGLAPLGRLVRQGGIEAIVVWGKPEVDWLAEAAARHRLPVWRAEDGFLRSVGLGSDHTPPLSMCLDKTGIYYDATGPSDLETLLATHDFAGDAALMQRAQALVARMLDSGVSKYNGLSKAGVPAQRDYVLVIGQCEDDASLRYGAEQGWTNRKLAELAIRENPGARIVYKPHPDVAIGRRKRVSYPEELTPALELVPGNAALPPMLAKAAKVYTITSLSGFEAVLRGIPTVVTGMPFYAGWGVTDDRATCARRSRTLAPVEIFAAAYLLYTRYFDPIEGGQLTAEEVVDRLAPPAGAAAGRAMPAGKPAEPPAGKGAKTPTAKGKAKPAAGKPGPKPAVTPAPGGAPPAAKPSSEDPAWYAAAPPPRASRGVPTFLYVPWIPEHGDALIAALRARSPALDFVPLNLIDRSFDPQVRREVSRLARKSPEIWRRLILRRLLPEARDAAGLIVTHDWHPVMREVVHAAASLGLPSVLVPHESVFMNEQLYYTMAETGAAVPATDHALLWGEMQARIFTARGYPAERLRITGSPKFDALADYRPQLGREAFCGAFGLDPARPILLFAAQPMDLQTADQKAALGHQARAIGDALDHATRIGAQLLVRQPASNVKVLPGGLRERCLAAPNCALDGPANFLVAPAEALHHAAAVLSVNSTMLFEAVLMGRPAIATRYFDFPQIWEQVGIPAAATRDELGAALDRALAGGAPLASAEGMEWARRQLAAGAFDGGAAARIAAELARIAAMPRQAACRGSRAAEVIARPDPGGIIVNLPNKGAINHEQAYLPGLLGASRLICAQSTEAAEGADVFAQWGIAPTENKARLDRVRRALGRSRLILEDGFIRSMNIGLSREPALSVILDDVTAYYDATQPSRLCARLNGPRELTAEERARARLAMRRIVAGRISKYNHAPIVRLSLGEPGRRKILLVDQRFRDQSVTAGLADERSFTRMLMEAIEQDEDADILVKRHPDAIGGGKDAYFADARIGFVKAVPRVHLIDFDVNPHCLIELADEVRVVTSGFGFEALMAGKPVRCYGAPYYAGWGLTEDRIAVPHRHRARGLEDLFHAAWIEFSRYWHPELGRRCEVEDIIDLVLRLRDGDVRRAAAPAAPPPAEAIAPPAPPPDSATLPVPMAAE